MTFDELCSLAGKGKPLPRFALPLERVAYRGLAWLYHAYRRGAFSKDEAAEEKEALRREYEDARKKEKDDLKLHQYVDQIRVALGGQFKAVKKSGCPVCRRLIENLDGVIVDEMKLDFERD